MKKLIIGLFTICIGLASCTPGTTSASPSDSSTPTPSTTTPITPEVSYIINVSAGIGGTVPTELNGKYPAQTDIELEATPLPGFAFYIWEIVDYLDNGSVISQWIEKQNPIRWIVQHNMDIVATFKEASELFNLNIIDGPHGGIPVGGAARYSGNYLEGETIGGLIVRSLPGWAFEGWTIYSSDYEVIGTLDRSVGTFAMPPYDVILVAEYREVAG